MEKVMKSHGISKVQKSMNPDTAITHFETFFFVFQL